MPRVLQCVAALGFSSRVLVTTASTWASVIEPGAPGRGEWAEQLPVHRMRGPQDLLRFDLIDRVRILGEFGHEPTFYDQILLVIDLLLKLGDSRQVIVVLRGVKRLTACNRDREIRTRGL